jgi:hypothetical protein
MFSGPAGGATLPARLLVANPADFFDFVDREGPISFAIHATLTDRSVLHSVGQAFDFVHLINI